MPDRESTSAPQEAPAGSPPGPLRRLVGALWLTPRLYFHRDAFKWAAALSFHSLLALVPLIFIAFSMLGFIQDMFDLDGGLEQLLIHQGLPDAAAKAGEVLRGLVDHVRTSSRGVGALGFAFLLWTAYGLFGTFEAACNALWRIRRRNAQLRSVRTCAIIMAAGPLLMGASLYGTARLQRYALEEGGAYLGPTLRYAVQAAPLALTLVTFYLLYRLVPATRVSRGSALLGALVAGTMWEGAKWGFNFYVSQARQIDTLYGPLAILPLFIIWVQLTWIIALLGVQLSHVHQEYAQIAAEVRGSRAERKAHKQAQKSVQKPDPAAVAPTDLPTVES